MRCKGPRGPKLTPNLCACGTDTKVLRVWNVGKTRHRRRACLRTGFKFTTGEFVVECKAVITDL